MHLPQVGGLDPFLPFVQGVDTRRDQAGCQQCPLDRVGGLAGHEHRLDVADEGIEKVGQRLLGLDAGEIHLGRQWLALALILTATVKS